MGKEGVLYYPLPCRVVTFWGSGTGSNLKNRVVSTLGYPSGPGREWLTGVDWCALWGGEEECRAELPLSHSPNQEIHQFTKSGDSPLNPIIHYWNRFEPFTKSGYSPSNPIGHPSISYCKKRIHHSIAHSALPWWCSIVLLSTQSTYDLLKNILQNRMIKPHYWFFRIYWSLNYWSMNPLGITKTPKMLAWQCLTN